MSRAHWHILREDRALTLSRRLPARFDVVAETYLPPGSRLRIAQQVRQDMWRRLRNMRGFAPVVQVTDAGDRLHVRAGGAFPGAFPRARAEAEIAALLACPDNRARWSRFARHREARHG